jgi:flagellar basal-body rod modification protein FlgD
MTTSTSSATSASLLGNQVTSYESQANAAKSKPVNQMGKQDFLTLFTAQLKNQNPLDPMQNEAFVAQLAQFSQLEATTNMSSSMDKLVSTMGGDKLLTASNLIGRRVAVDNSPVSVTQGQSTSASIQLPQGASGLVINVLDSSGGIVTQLNGGARTPGTFNFTWDGTDSTGNPAPSGTYSFTANAVVNGKNQSVTVNTLATVQSVTTSPSDGSISLNLVGGKTLPLSQVTQIVN